MQSFPTSRALACILVTVGVALASPGCTRAPAGREDGTAACSNGMDDDGDGLTDCAEAACAGLVVCGGSGDSGTGGDDGGGLPDASLYDAPPVVCVDPIDLVFVLDVSTSMASEASRLRAGIGSIFAAADALTMDHTFGLVVFVDDELVVNGCSSFPTAASLQTEFDHWRDFCASNENPGGGGSNADCAENSLDALYAAATMCTWRPGATHILIHVTDDTFEEPPYTYSADPFGGGGVRAMRHYSQVVDALVASQIRVGAFAMEVPEECGAGTSDDTARGFFTPFFGLPSLPEATGGRVWDIADVRAGTLDMATAISEMITDEHCTVF
jgi:hypothetical protein